MGRKMLAVLGVAGLGAYYYSRGKLPALKPVVEKAQGIASHILPQDMWTYRDPAKVQEAEQIREASGGQVVPILGPSETVSTNVYEAMLRTHYAFLRPWSRKNIGWTAAICKVENSPRDPMLVGDNGHAFGVMQVHIPTAETCYRSGYTHTQPTQKNLQTYEGGIYFGTAELDRLANMGKPLEWIICAYNGGAGWEKVSEQYRNDRLAYLKRVQSAFVSLYGGAMA